MHQSNFLEFIAIENVYKTSSHQLEYYAEDGQSRCYLICETVDSMWLNCFASEFLVSLPMFHDFPQDNPFTYKTK